METKLPTLNQSPNATLPPPQPTRRAVLSPSSALALSSPPALPPRRRCRGPRRGCAGRRSASGLPWAWGSSASQVRARSRLGVDRAGAEFPDQLSGRKPLPAPPSPRSTPTPLPTLRPGLSLHPSSHQHTLETQLPDTSLAQVSILPSSRSWVLFHLMPRRPRVSLVPFRGASPRSVVLHGPRTDILFSRGLERPDLPNCCDSEALFPLHPEPWQPSPSAVTAVPSKSPASSLLSVLFSRVRGPHLSLTQPHLFFALASTCLPLPGKSLENQFVFLPPREVPSSHHCCVRQRPRLTSHPPSPPHGFPSLHRHLGDQGSLLPCPRDALEV